MTNTVEIKRLIAELHRVRAARYELEFKVAESEALIERYKDGMATQDSHIEKLKEDLVKLGADLSNF